ncbi:MAG TPA: FkbM family methyltransferase [Thermoanaerobaculia bacterium]|nr:FkbM family methyltransferase [Thermoanaerobaculia bacterium]
MKARFLYRAFKARYRDQRLEILAATASLQAADTAVDVGAHKGAYLFWLRRAVGVAGKVFAYEPQPTLARYLQSVCSLMEWGNVFVRDCAISDSAGIKTLHVPGSRDSPGASLERAVLDTTACHSYECHTDTIDHQLREAGRIAFLKVDVEGHELRVFRGATETLSRHRPVILFECEARHLSSHSMQDVFGFLEGFGYQGSFFSPRGLLPLDDFDPEVHQRRDGERFWDAPGYCNNFLFQTASLELQ